MKRIALFIVIAICLFFGCRSDISFPPPPHDSTLVLFATIYQNQTEIFVSNSVDSKNEVAPLGLNDALVTIEEADGNVFLSSSTQDGLIISNITPKYGENYTISVEKQGFETIQSTTEMPPSFNIDSLKIELSDSIPLDNNRFRLAYSFEIELEEPSEEIGYYEIQCVFSAILREDSTFIEKPDTANFVTLPNSEIVELENDDNQIFFVKNTNKKQIRFGAEFDHEEGEYLKKVDITVKSSTQEDYDYASSVINQIKPDSGGIVSINPIEVLSNIENGYGFFTAHHIGTIQKRIPR